MRFTTGLAAAALVALGADARRGVTSDYAHHTVRKTKDHLERTHGKGLVGMFDENGQIHSKHIKQGFKSDKLGAAQIQIEGIENTTFNLDSFVTNFLGFVNGMTYRGVQADEALTNCFYAGYSLVQSVDEIIYIFENATNQKGSYKWFQYALHEPAHFILNTTVFYQMCNWYETFDMFNGWFNLDYTLFAFDAGSMLTNGLVIIPDVITEFKLIKCEGLCNCPDEDGNVPFVEPGSCTNTVNQYALGETVGSEFAKFFNQFVNPVVF